MQQEQHLVTVGDLCRTLGISESTLTRICAGQDGRKRIPYYQVGGRKKFNLDEVMQALEVKNDSHGS